MEDELLPSTPGKGKIERSHTINRQFHRCFASTGNMFLWALFLIALIACYLSFESFAGISSRYFRASWGGMRLEKQIRASATPRRPGAISVLVTGAAGFVGTHVSLALRKRGDGVVGLDNFNSYYDPSLKKARKALLASHGVLVVEGDINDARLLARLFDVVPFTHVMHLAAQAGVRYAIEKTSSYPAVVRPARRSPTPTITSTASPSRGSASSPSTGHGDAPTWPTSPSPATSSRKPITVYRGKNHIDLARDFTYIDDVVKGCVASPDTAQKSTGSGGQKRGPAQYHIYNLGNTSPVTVPTLVRILERHLKVKAMRNVVEMPANGDVPFTHANIRTALAELGYSPATNLETGLKRFVKWYLSYYGYNPARGTLASSAATKASKSS
ncbi:unnamed protein product [Musa acuminata subsp. malaccensis]|uniref:(wild Malaysian banana) hypothetical protein n=1 Tax=Musa acuminata subsp. malaccensis TaxID=214687 RepID=A0A804JAZ9_MUSAM|nr:unnamed protein product [Musa acuminata subsp. malaccensis]